jgi:hypothetical protein
MHEQEVYYLEGSVYKSETLNQLGLNMQHEWDQEPFVRIFVFGSSDRDAENYSAVANDFEALNIVYALRQYVKHHQYITHHTIVELRHKSNLAFLDDSTAGTFAWTTHFLDAALLRIILLNAFSPPTHVCIYV